MKEFGKESVCCKGVRSSALTTFGRGVGSAGRVMTLGRKNAKSEIFCYLFEPGNSSGGGNNEDQRWKSEAGKRLIEDREPYYSLLQVCPFKTLQGEALLASFQDLRRGGTLSGRISTTTSIMSPTSNVLRCSFTGSSTWIH